MPCIPKRKWFRSNPRAWAASDIWNPDLSFLDGAKGMRSPVIDQMILHTNVNYTTGVAIDWDSQDFARLYAEIHVNDGCDDIRDVTGHQLRTINISEYGSGHADPQISAQNATEARDVFLNIPFGLPYTGAARRMKPRLETALPLEILRDGGSMQLNFAAALIATGITINSGTTRIYALVRESSEKELRGRLIYRRHAVNNLEDNYKIGGALRSAFVQSTAVAEGFTTWAAMVSITSEALGYSVYDLVALRRMYLLEQGRGRLCEAGPGFGVFAANPLVTGVGQPIWWPDANGEVGDLPVVDSIKVIFAGAALPTTGFLVYSAIRDRVDSQSAKVLGMPEPLAKAAINAQGVVPSVDGGQVPVGKLPDDLRSKLPVILAGGRTP